MDNLWNLDRYLGAKETKPNTFTTVSYSQENIDEVFKEIRRQHYDIPVILSSGYNEGEATQRFVGRGLAGFIQKPYKLSSLKEKLEEVLG